MRQILRVARLSPLLSTAFLALVSPAADSQTASLVRDLTEGAPDVSASSSPRDLAAAGTHVFFSAEVAGAGRELWASDGTAAGTRLLGDLCPGSCDGSSGLLAAWGHIVLFDRSPLWRSDGTPAGTFSLDVDSLQAPVRFGNALWFAGRTPDTGLELWRTDGTRGGTRLMVELEPGTESGVESPLVVSGGRLYFFSRASGEQALWRSNGSAAGTVLVAPLPGLPVPTPPLTPAAGRVFFLNGGELWSSDGTREGTAAVATFSTGKAFWSPLLPGTRGVYFAANDGQHGVEVWFSNGTAGGTARVTDFAEPEPYLGQRIEPWMWSEVNGHLVLLADGGAGPQLWLGGGRKPPIPLEGLTVSVLSGLVRAGNRVLFRADDGLHGYELWRTDGTAAGTALVLDLCPGVCDGQVTVPQPLSGATAPRAAFLGWEPDHGTQIWTSDGTSRGTRRRTSVPAGTLVADGFTVAAVGDRLFFPARDGHGEELWTAGGAAGGQRLADLALRATSSELSWLTPLGDRLVFAGPTRGRTLLWGSGGTADSTVPLGASTIVWSGDDIRTPLAAVGGKVFFREDDDHGGRIWATDGTVAGSFALTPSEHRVKDPATAAWNGLAVFPGAPYGGSPEIWTSDGTLLGTRPTLFLPPDLELSPSPLAAFGRDLLIATRQGLFHSDSLTSQVTLLSGEADFQSSPAPLFQKAGSLIFFEARSTSRSTLWRTDGTAAGTWPLDLSYDWGYRFWDLTPFGSCALFAVDDDESRTIVRTDGTDAGTLALTRFRVPYNVDAQPYGEDPTPAWMVVLGDRIFFPGWDFEHGRELWTSDGTPEGTQLLLDLVPGPESSDPTWLIVAHGRLWFAATDQVHGRELWTSDGTAEGSRIVQDLAPGALSSSPEQMTAGSHTLWFVADDGRTGRELWRLPLDDKAFPASTAPQE